MSWVTPAMLSSSPFRTYSSLLTKVDLVNWNVPQVKMHNIELRRRHCRVLAEIGRSQGGWLFPEKVYFNDPIYVTHAPRHVEALDRLIMERPS